MLDDMYLHGLLGSSSNPSGGNFTLETVSTVIEVTATPTISTPIMIDPDAIGPITVVCERDSTGTKLFFRLDVSANPLEDFPTGGGGDLTSGYQVIDFGGTLTDSTTFASLGITDMGEYKMNWNYDSPSGPTPGEYDITMSLPNSLTIADFIGMWNGQEGIGFHFELVNGNLKTSSVSTGTSSNICWTTPASAGFWESCTGFVDYDTPVNGTGGADYSNLTWGEVPYYTPQNSTDPNGYAWSIPGGTALRTRVISANTESNKMMITYKKLSSQ